MRRSLSVLSSLAVAAASVGAVGLAPGASAAPAPRQRVARTAPTWLAHVKSAGRAKAAGTSTFQVYLAPRGGLAAVKSAVAAVSDPSSPRYRKFLTPAQYHAQYDATDATVTRVRGFLRSQGLSVTAVEAHHRYLSVRGSNADVEKAFKVVMRSYRHAGRTVQANDRAVSLPATIASAVTTVAGLDTTPHRKQPGAQPEIAPPGAGFRNARPCSRYYGQVAATYQADFKTKLPKYQGKTLPYAVCGYNGKQLRGAYEGATAGRLNGKGVTVAIVDAFASPTIAQDAATYAKRQGDPGYAAGQLSQVKPSSVALEDECDASGWYGEETLDVEAVHNMAPGANIRYYGARSCEDAEFTPVLTKIVDENKASFVSNSYGDTGEDVSPDLIAAEESVFQQGALQGIGFLFSSGDSGDEEANTGTRQPDYSASDPYVTAVGGTSVAIGADNTFLGQTGWGTEKSSLSADGKTWGPAAFTSGAGGGTSSLFNKPSYQRGVVPGSFGSGRAVPDVGLDADPTTGMLVGQTQTFADGVYYDEYRIGGTSLAAPLYAGMAALASQHANKRLGFLNPAIYRQAGSSVFTDIKGAPSQVGNVRADYANSVDGDAGLLYSVRLFNKDSSLQVAPGWDDVTGLGAPNEKWLTSLAK